MGFNPFRQQRRSTADYVMVAAALAVCALLVAWALFGVIVDDEVETRRVQPYEATKTYRCPGCNGEIAVGLGHLVVVPVHTPDMRRHWHHGCWRHRDRRRPGRLRP